MMWSPLLIAWSIRPDVIPAAVVQASIADLAQEGMGTERTRPPFPIKVTMTQRPSRC